MTERGNKRTAGAQTTRIRVVVLAPGCKLCATNRTPYETTPTPASNCLRGGSSSLSPGAWGATAAPWPHHPHYMPVCVSEFLRVFASFQWLPEK
ncbi:hypothetical protein L208DRAFT_1385392 [Tricholoma matsutake]|nr:hypothetical protein L208DRAFT_1385392 [Tricholoma matsutake 945]